MDDLLRELLERLAAVGANHDELFDSDVRDAMGHALFNGFVRGEGLRSVPTDFGLYTGGANAEARDAICHYIVRANRLASELGVSGFRDRLASLQNRKVRTNDGSEYEDFFGHYPSELYDSNGNAIRTQ